MPWRRWPFWRLAMGIMMAVNVVRSNREYNRSIADLWEELETAYSQELLRFCSDEQVIACSSLLCKDTGLAQRLYDFRAGSLVRCRFFWLGAQGEVLALWYSSGLFLTNYGKITPELAGREGLAPVMDLWMYTQEGQALDGFLKIYTMTEIGQYTRVLGAVAVVFGRVFAAAFVYLPGFRDYRGPADALGEPHRGSDGQHQL